MQTTPHLEYHQEKSIREAIGREIARQVGVTDDVREAKEKADDALRNYRDAIRQAARKALESMA